MRHPEPFASLEYDAETAIKQTALEAFWKEHHLPCGPERLVAAPVPRGYRTTSKRRVVATPKGLAFTFPGAPSSRQGLAPSALDLPEHSQVYAFLMEHLPRPGVRPLSSKLNWVIVRGSKGELALILNVRRLDAPVVRAAKRLAEMLEAAPIGVRSGSLYLDPTGSDYYLETRRPEGPVSFKRLFGPELLEVDAGGTALRFPPTVFSQVNGPMLGVVIEWAGRLIAPVEGRSLLDLYCGYGLFSLTVGREARQVLGVDFERPAIDAARANAKRLGRAGQYRFLSGLIGGAFVAERLPSSPASEIVLLDPPRQGTAPGVIPALATRGAERIVHICCGADEIPREIAAWARSGYRLRRAVPLDLFAGTANVETMLLLSR